MTNDTNNTNTTAGPTLVLAATGKTGRRVADRLAALDVPVRRGSRSAEIPFDWEDPATWAPALEGVASVYLVFYPDLAAPGAPKAVRGFTDAAVAAGVRRIVLLSGRGEEEARECERIVQGSGLEWTIVRASWFAQNFSEDYLLEPVLGGEVVLPAGEVAEPFADADDIADVAVAALTEDRHVGQVYEVTGPRALTFAEAVDEIGKAAGREVSYVQVPLDAYAAVLREHGLPDDVVEFLVYLFGTILDGRNSEPQDGVRRALGREPNDFADYAHATAAAGVWKA
ncbi:NAD(P)H-binding protein [Spirillospora sp. NPDC127200]